MVKNNLKGKVNRVTFCPTLACTTPFTSYYLVKTATSAGGRKSKKMHSKTSFTKVNNNLANSEDLGMIEVVGRYTEKNIGPTYFWEQLLINRIWTTPNMMMVSNHAFLCRPDTKGRRPNYLLLTSTIIIGFWARPTERTLSIHHQDALTLASHKNIRQHWTKQKMGAQIKRASRVSSQRLERWRRVVCNS
jgi:hypothetical protein